MSGLIILKTYAHFIRTFIICKCHAKDSTFRPFNIFTCISPDWLFINLVMEKWVHEFIMEHIYMAVW